jgi:ML domain
VFGYSFQFPQNRMSSLLSLVLSIASLVYTDAASKTLRYNNSKALILVNTTLGSAKSCTAAADLAKNFVVTIDNDTPAPDSYVTTTFDFDLDAPITGGTAYYSATLNGLGPFTSQAPLCDETAKTNDPCPLAVGHHHEVSVAQNTVTGKVVTTITWYDEAGTQILCAEISTKSS